MIIFNCYKLERRPANGLGTLWYAEEFDPENERRQRWGFDPRQCRALVQVVRWHMEKSRSPIQFVQALRELADEIENVMSLKGSVKS